MASQNAGCTSSDVQAAKQPNLLGGLESKKMSETWNTYREVFLKSPTVELLFFRSTYGMLVCLTASFFPVRFCVMLAVLCAGSASDPVALYAFNVPNHCMMGISPNHSGNHALKLRNRPLRNEFTGTE